MLIGTIFSCCGDSDSSPAALALAIAEATGEVNLARGISPLRRSCGGAGLASDTYQQPRPNLCAPCVLLISTRAMTAERIAAALARIEQAMTRIDAAAGRAAGGGAGTGGAAVSEAHEKLRARVSESLRELDDLLAQLEGQEA